MKYKDKCEVKSGFFEGNKGHVVNYKESVSYGGYEKKYLVSLNDCREVWIDEFDLKEIKDE